MKDCQTLIKQIDDELWISRSAIKTIAGISRQAVAERINKAKKKGIKIRSKKQGRNILHPIEDLETIFPDYELRKIARSEDIENIGDELPHSKTLLDTGYSTIQDILSETPHELAVRAGITRESAAEIIAKAQVLAGEIKLKKLSMMLRDQHKDRISTGSKIDALVDGGFETRAITELFGKSGAGKSQLCYQLAVNVQLPEKEGGLQGEAILIDTEGKLSPERILQIARAKGLDKRALGKIHVAEALTTEEQSRLLNVAFQLAEKRNIRLLILDSLTANFRVEYSGRDSLPDRGKKLKEFVGRLRKFCREFDAAVVITNQISEDVDWYQSETKALGGNVVAHTAKYRLELRRSKGEMRVARLVSAPYLPEGEVTFRITDKGIL